MRRVFFLATMAFCLGLIPAKLHALQDLLNNESFRSLRPQIQKQYEKGEFQSALEGEKELVQMVQERYGPIHPLLAQVLGDLGMMQRNLGQYGEAEKNLKWSLAIVEKTLDAGSPNRASALEKLSDLYRDTARYSEALFFEKQAAAIREKNNGIPAKASSKTRLGRLEMESGDLKDAESDLSEAVTLFEKSGGGQNPGLIEPLRARAEWGIASRKWDMAQKDLERALDITIGQYTDHGAETADVLRALGDFYGRKGVVKKSKSYYEQALKIYQKLLIGNVGYLALDKMEKAGAVLRGMGSYQEAFEWDTKALQVEKEVFGPEHPRVALCEARISWDEEFLGKKEQARSNRREAKAILQAALGDSHPLVQAVDQRP